MRAESASQQSAVAAAAQRPVDDRRIPDLPLGALHIQPWPDGGWLVGGQSGQHLVAGDETLRILKALAACGSIADAHRAYCADGGHLAIDGFAVHARRCIQCLCADSGARKSRKRYLKLRKVLIPEAAVDRIATRASIAFDPRVAPVGLLIALVAPVLVAFVLSRQLGLLWLGNVQSAIVFAIVVAGAMVHEIGHAAALRHYRQPSGPIGIGLYLGFLPVFYTDISRAWRLPVRARVVVNLGGVHFQSIYATVLMASGWLLSSDMLLAAGAASLMLAIAQTIPFARADGYWVLSDVMREPQLASFDPALLQQCRAPGRHGQAARRRLAYLALNLLVVGGLLVSCIHHALGFWQDIRNSISSGVASTTLLQPWSWLPLAFLGVFAFRWARAAAAWCLGKRRSRQPA